MRIPMQAEPVHRTSEVLFPEGGIAPSGDGCRSGYYCCVDVTGTKRCVDCGTTPCALPALTVCGWAGLLPASGC